MIFHWKKQLELSIQLKQFDTLDWHEWVILRNADSNRASDQPCSGGAPAVACTEVISVFETSTDESVIIITESVSLRYSGA